MNKTVNQDKEMKPSNFTKYPWNSVLQNGESEQIALNIMVILKRTGDIFRDLTWDEYKSERLKDKNFSEGEQTFFNKVIDYCKNEDTAKLLSETWR